MTQSEFAQGWKLLILQPWGWRYRALDQDGKPTSEAQLQLQFYFDKLQWLTGAAWLEVATLFAQGDEWPSLSALQTAGRQTNARYVKTLPPSPAADPPTIGEQEARAILKRLGITLP